MGSPQSLPPILIDWCSQLLGHSLLSPDYKHSRSAPGGSTLIDELALQLASELYSQAQQHGLELSAAVIMAAQRDAPEQRQLNTDAKARASHLYLIQLHADLSDRPVPEEDGAPGKPSPRHLAAQGELWLDAYHQLVRAKSRHKKPWSYAGALAYFKHLNYTEGDFRNDFWEDIWPDILNGRQSAGHQPVKPAAPDEIYSWLTTRARAFLTHKVRELYREHSELVAFERSLGGDDDATPDQEQALAEDAATISDASRGFSTEPRALGHFDEEALLQQVLLALMKSAKTNRLGFLIFLLLLDLRDLDDKRRGPIKKKQIADLLNKWKDDRAELMRYLTDPENGIGLDDDLAAEIVAAMEPGFAAFTGPIIPLRVGDLLDEFLAAMREHLDRGWFDHQPPDADDPSGGVP